MYFSDLQDIDQYARDAAVMHFAMLSTTIVVSVAQHPRAHQ